ncbi:ParB/RepB/Spo0J family partition protein [Sulfuriflexus sp.]|uniref:ParB/RepB/Spo0J family partition protein n=1 Tax=Sulfuriflexus sp. TaxID=2015443 RepID=UPI0028CCF615|nr:ParB/RepB/Spo0J family partition protein [Sulfuriflexus sp.]MDT8404098.1 ParB/RepB/Spo0J family partition protein [Sulfuriflexus sp.]
MATRKRGLGRGLDALLGSAGNPATIEQASKESDLREIPVDLMQRGKYQPRVDMHTESLQELADSIRAQGVVQPIVVRPIGGGKYEIIAGERRWRASQMAGLHEIPAVVRDVPDSAAIAMALIENIQREDLNPLEEAHALQRLIDEFEMTHQQASEAVGRSRAAVSNLLRLQELNEEVQRLLERGELGMGHARALLGLRGPAQTAAAQQVVKRALSVRETEHLVRRESEKVKRIKSAATTHIDPDIRRFQEDLSARLGARVQIQHGDKGKGKLSIQYNSLDELEGILGHIK